MEGRCRACETGTMRFEEKRIRERLVECGKKLLCVPPEAQPLLSRKPPDSDKVQQQEHQEARSLISDLHQHPHAVVIGCIMDRQLPADRACLIPYRLSQRIGGHGMPGSPFFTSLGLPEEEIHDHRAGPPTLRRFN